MRPVLRGEASEWEVTARRGQQMYRIGSRLAEHCHGVGIAAPNAVARRRLPGGFLVDVADGDDLDIAEGGEGSHVVRADASAAHQGDAQTQGFRGTGFSSHWMPRASPSPTAFPYQSAAGLRPAPSSGGKQRRAADR